MRSDPMVVEIDKLCNFRAFIPSDNFYALQKRSPTMMRRNEDHMKAVQLPLPHSIEPFDSRVNFPILNSMRFFLTHSSDRELVSAHLVGTVWCGVRSVWSSKEKLKFNRSSHQRISTVRSAMEKKWKVLISWSIGFENKPRRLHVCVLNAFCRCDLSDVRRPPHAKLHLWIIVEAKIPSQPTACPSTSRTMCPILTFFSMLRAPHPQQRLVVHGRFIPCFCGLNMVSVLMDACMWILISCKSPMNNISSSSAAYLVYVHMQSATKCNPGSHARSIQYLN